MTQNFVKLCTRIKNAQIMSNSFQFLSKFIFLKNFLLVFLVPNLVQFYSFFCNFFNLQFVRKINLKSIISIFCQIILVFSMTFGVLTSIPVHAQDGVIGFSDCKFGSAEEIRKNGTGGTAVGNETFRKCLQQILTFVFVLGVFLIGIRIALEAFKSLNPVISGNSINNSVKLGQDIVIGLILIGAPSIFLGLFNEAALQLPNLFELAQYRPGNEAAKTSATGSGTGTSGTSTTGGGGSGTTGTGGSGTGGAGATGTGLIVDGKEVLQKDLQDAIKARDDGKPLTPTQDKILKEFDKKNASQNVFIDKATGDVARSTVENALKFVKNNPTSGSAEFNTGLNYARGLLTNCLTNPKGDNLSCQLMKESGIQLGAEQYRVLSPDGADFKLSPNWSKIGGGSPTVGGTGTELKIVIQKQGTPQKVELRQKCRDATQTSKSPIANPNFVYTEGQNLNLPGCSITAVYQNI